MHYDQQVEKTTISSYGSRSLDEPFEQATQDTLPK